MCQTQIDPTVWQLWCLNKLYIFGPRNHSSSELGIASILSLRCEATYTVTPPHPHLQMRKTETSYWLFYQYLMTLARARLLNVHFNHHFFNQACRMLWVSKTLLQRVLYCQTKWGISLSLMQGWKGVEFGLWPRLDLDSYQLSSKLHTHHNTLKSRILALVLMAVLILTNNYLFLFKCSTFFLHHLSHATTAHIFYLIKPLASIHHFLEFRLFLSIKSLFNLNFPIIIY